MKDKTDHKVESTAKKKKAVTLAVQLYIKHIWN